MLIGSRNELPAEHSTQHISYCDKTYSLYPASLDTLPAIPSPFTTDDGTEIVTARKKDGTYVLIPVTIENGQPLDYRKQQWGKGWQLEVDGRDFPTLVATGLHGASELDRTRTVAGIPVADITAMARPGQSSWAGFVAHDEDILSVLKGDNHLLQHMDLTHPQLARPLFHIWNMALFCIQVNGHRRWALGDVDTIFYNGRSIVATVEGTKGWQESIFDDEILGMHDFDVRTEMNRKERAFLRKAYPDLGADRMKELIDRVSSFHTGEMVPYYIMRYGFYEGHTGYRADPIAIAFIFGLKDIEEIEEAFEGNLYRVLTDHFTKENLSKKPYR